MGSLPRVARLRLRPPYSRLISRASDGVALPAWLAGAGSGSVGAGVLAGLATTLTAVLLPLSHAGASSRHIPVQADPPAARRPLAGFLSELQQPIALAPASAPAAPAPPAVAAAPPLRKHELFGFAPYWTLDASPGFDLHALTTLAYFALSINPDGSLQQSGDGWDGYNSQDLATLTDRAHAAGARVVLTVTDFDDTQIHQLVSDPSAAPRLAAQLVSAIRARNMDGANLDVEATGGGDRAAYVAFVSQVARTLHAANPHWQVTVDTYAGSANDPASFFDVAGLAPSVDAFFVMAYDMYGDGQKAQPNAPLDNYSFNDTDAMASYTGVVPSGKVLLGTPFYGYDWQVTSNQPNAPTVGDPSPLTYADITAAKHPVQWDPRGSVPYTTYQAGDRSWHETYYDNPQSLALKAQLVNTYHLRGLGVWALGMDGNDPAMMAALLGHAAPLKVLLGGSHAASSGSSSTSTSSSSSSSSASGSATPKPSPTPTPSSSSGGGAPPAPTAPPQPPPPTLPPPPLPSPTSVV